MSICKSMLCEFNSSYASRVCKTLLCERLYPQTCHISSFTDSFVSEIVAEAFETLLLWHSVEETAAVDPSPQTTTLLQAAAAGASPALRRRKARRASLSPQGQKERFKKQLKKSARALRHRKTNGVRLRLRHGRERAAKSRAPSIRPESPAMATTHSVNSPGRDEHAVRDSFVTAFATIHSVPTIPGSNHWCGSIHSWSDIQSVTMAPPAMRVSPTPSAGHRRAVEVALIETASESRSAQRRRRRRDVPNEPTETPAVRTFMGAPRLRKLARSELRMCICAH